MSAMDVTEPVQLECRIVIIRHPSVSLAILGERHDRSVEVGMFDPVRERYERLGRHRPDEVDRVVGDLKQSIERAGHLLTFCDRHA